MGGLPRVVIVLQGVGLVAQPVGVNGVQHIHFLQKFFFRFHKVWIRQTDIHRADRSALGFVEKSNTLGAFIGDDVEIISRPELG